MAWTLAAESMAEGIWQAITKFIEIEDKLEMMTIRLRMTKRDNSEIICLESDLHLLCSFLLAKSAQKAPKKTFSKQ